MTVGSLSNLKLSSTGGGAIILIGPIPIIVGAGQNSLAFVTLGVFLTVFVILFFFLLRKRSRVS
jgi:LPXTG-motif cell wall-anchored protein